MSQWKELEQRFTERLSLKRRPVSVTILDSEPADIPKFAGTEPSGCSFWRLAADGKSFYTVPSDHFNCPVGSYTHRIDLPEQRKNELNETLSLMFSVEYLQPEDVAKVPQLPKTPTAVVYAPLGDSPIDPSVVLFSCRPRAAMLLQEAASRANAASPLPILGRPTCMAIPAAMSMGTTASLGCIGNRVYTGIEEDDLYVAVPGNQLAAVDEALATIVAANSAIENYARSRRAALSTV
jgi:uncharacterized protein (DUF169 family)